MAKRKYFIKRALSVCMAMALVFSSANISPIVALAKEETDRQLETETSEEADIQSETETNKATDIQSENEANEETETKSENEAETEISTNEIEIQSEAEQETAQETEHETESETTKAELETIEDIETEKETEELQILEDISEESITEITNVIISEHQEQLLAGQDITLTYKADNDKFAFGDDYRLKINGVEIDENKEAVNITDKTITIPASLNTTAGMLKIEFIKENCDFSPVYQRVYKDTNTDKWNLVWQDEFNGTMLDPTKWDYQIGNGAAYGIAGWGNAEKQYYTEGEENSKVENGKLTITAKKDETHGYTSARIRTASRDEGKSLNGVPQTGTAYQAAAYGKIEAKMKLPKGQGLWPAFWLLPYNSKYGTWASGGEIDIMEARGRLPHIVSGALHYGSVWPNNVSYSEEYELKDSDITEYHIYTLEWDPTKITWLVDGVEYASRSNWYSILSDGTGYPYPAPFDEKFYILFNIAVGGNFDQAATEIEIGENGASMDIDYVRWYQREQEIYDNWLIEEPKVEKDESEAANELLKLTYKNGNYVNDANFEAVSVTPVTTNDSWEIKRGSWISLLIPGNGNGKAAWSKIKNKGKNYLKINVERTGSQMYSSQMLQYLPLIKGYKYELSYMAYTDEDNTKADVSFQFGGDAQEAWAKYSPNYIDKLTTQPVKYTHQFTMADNTDATARLEINLATSKGNVYISDVCVKLVDIEEGEDKKEEPVIENKELELTVKITDEPQMLTYTGSAIKPAIEVYNGEQLLIEKKDYTVKYNNNINVSKEAIITVKGKGNYKDSATTTFEILPKDLSELEIDDVHTIITENGEVIQPKIAVKYGKKKLKEYTDYKLEIPNCKDDSGIVRAGDYQIKIKAVEGGNYTGEKVINYNVLENSTLLMSKAKITVKTPTVEYNGEHTQKPQVVVKIGKTTLTSEQYDIICENIKIGKATLTVVGKNGVYGSKTAAYKIIGGIKLGSNIRLEGIESCDYTGSEITLEKMALYDNGKLLVPETDYIVKYTNNINAGKAKVVITGKGDYKGKITKTFKINKVNLNEYNTNTLISWNCTDFATYTKAGAIPEFTLKYNDIELVEKKDFTVLYKNNKKVSNGTVKATIIIKGKGNFTGKITDTFEVTYPTADAVYAKASDVLIPDDISSLEKNIKVKLYETSTNKLLKAGQDYEKNIECYILENDKERHELLPADLTADKKINVRITLKNNYKGAGEKPQTVETTVRLYNKKASTEFIVTPVADQIYKGKEIEPGISVTDKYGKQLTKDTDYSVEYENNINKGKAKIIITGIGNGYGGTKTVYFDITEARVKLAGSIAEKLAEMIDMMQMGK